MGLGLRFSHKKAMSTDAHFDAGFWFVSADPLYLFCCSVLYGTLYRRRRTCCIERTSSSRP